MDWDDLRYFVKVAETGSLLSAARFLRVNVATVGRHVERLETALGRKLFSRSQQGYRLTDEGVKLAQWAQRVQTEFADLPGIFRNAGGAPEGAVSLATTEPLANHFVVPLLPGFAKRYPLITLDISGEVRSVNLSRRESDIALRLGKMPAGNLKARRVAQVGYGFFAAPSYVKARGLPTLDDGFAGHSLISWPAADSSNAYGDWLRKMAPNARKAMQSSSGETRLMAARAGIGIALLPCFMVDRRSGLRRVAAEIEPPPVDLSLVSHADLAHRPAIRTVLDFLADSARTQRARLRGAAD